MILNIYSDKNPKAQKKDNSVEISKLSSDLCPNHSIDHIMVDQVLSYTDQEVFKNCLLFCMSKVRLGGTITIRDIDLDSLSLYLFNKTLSPNDFNNIILDRKYIHSAKDIKRIAMENKIEVDTLTLDNYNYTIQLIHNG
jgi:hypothetical protein